MKNSNNINITKEIIESGKNTHRVMNEWLHKAQAIADAYRSEDKGNTLNAQLSERLLLAKVNTIVSFVCETLGDESKYTQAVMKSISDNEYRMKCAETTDTKSVEYFVGRVYAGTTGDICTIIKNVSESACRSRGKQVKMLATELAGAAWFTEELWANSANIVKGNMQMLYADTYPLAVGDDATLTDVCTMAIYKKKAKKAGK